MGPERGGWQLGWTFFETWMGRFTIAAKAITKTTFKRNCFGRICFFLLSQKADLVEWSAMEFIL